MNELMFYATETVKDYLEKAEQVYGRKFAMPTVCFGLRGRTAGYAAYLSNTITLNKKLFSENQDCFLKRTIPHELAHLIAYQLYGSFLCRKPHGELWQSVMKNLDVKDDSRCHSYKTTPARVVKHKFTYGCACRVRKLTAIKHNRILRGVKYRCRGCGHTLYRTSGVFDKI